MNTGRFNIVVMTGHINDTLAGI